MNGNILGGRLQVRDSSNTENTEWGACTLGKKQYGMLLAMPYT